MKKFSSKRALLLSVLSMVICVSMLIGSTFAWFTDSATASVNTIKSGNLDVELVKPEAKADGTYEPLGSEALKWVAKDGRAQDKILWEPGCEYNLESFRIQNNGDLALKYKVVISGLTGNAKLLEAIDFTVSVDGDALVAKDGESTVSTVADLNNFEGTLKAGDVTGKITITGTMKTTAGNDYRGLSLEGISITVYATQLAHEFDSNRNTYDENAKYPSGVTIIGLDGTYDNLTAASKAWRESKGVVTSGNTFGMNSLGTVDSLTWIISGETEIGDGEGVIGNNGAGQSILGGGYFTPSVTVNKVIVKGVNDAKIAKTGDSYLISAAGKNVVYENITFVDTVRIDSNPANLIFRNCKFEAGLRIPHSATGANVTIENCTFTGYESSGYAIFAQGNMMASFNITGNEISGCQRGINVQAGNNAVVTISGNTIKNIAGKTDGFTYGAAIQMTSAKTFTVTGNTISDVAVNALHIYNGCPAESITIKDNNISAAYLCWNEADYDMSKVVSSGNTLYITKAGRCVTKTAEVDSAFTLN